MANKEMGDELIPPKKGGERWFTETFSPEGHTIMTKMRWNGKDWEIADNQDYPSSVEDVRRLGITVLK